MFGRKRKKNQLALRRSDERQLEKLGLHQVAPLSFPEWYDGAIAPGVTDGQLSSRQERGRVRSRKITRTHSREQRIRPDEVWTRETVTTELTEFDSPSGYEHRFW